MVFIGTMPLKLEFFLVYNDRHRFTAWQNQKHVAIKACSGSKDSL